jgi:cell division protein FtsI/penicillin-binding protein 2
VDAFEPGSTFKPFIWSGAVQAGVGSTRPVPTDAQGRITVNLGPIPIPGRRNTVKDAGINPYHGPLKDIETILIRSLNTGMVEMVRPLSDIETREILVRFGFGSRTNCGLGGSAEHAGQITSLKRWSFANTSVSVSFGHEVSVTTLQMGRAFSAFCNRGMMPQLRLVKPSQKSKDTPVLDSAPLLMRRAIPGSIADRTKRALGKVVTEGTLRRHARSELYSMFGKSGTADLPKPGGGYFKDRHTSNVIAAAPYDEPKVIVVCVIDDPDKKIGHYGGTVAGPVVKDLVDLVLDYEGVAPDLGSQADRDAARFASRVREIDE